MKIKASAVLLMAAALQAQQAQQPQLEPNKSPDQLRDLARLARSSGDLETEANYLCQAAAQDSRRYGRRCSQARDAAAKAETQFTADVTSARAELQRKDYAAALRDLGKVTFGPLRPQAQALILQARFENGTLPPGPVSQLALAQASAAFSRGDFNAAEAWLRRVEVPALQAAAGQLEARIGLYRRTMNEAEALARGGDLQGAAKRYQFAAAIQPNGPGEPLERLRQVQQYEQRVRARSTEPPPPQPAPQPAPQAAPAPATNNPGRRPATESAGRISSGLEAARSREASGDLKGALDAYDAVLVLDRRQPDALAARSRLADEIRDKDDALEAGLREGVGEFYASHLSKAYEEISSYLAQGGQDHAGAAHFYLGATLLCQAILADQRDKAGADALRRQGQEQFALARQAHYGPLASAISPRILAEWTEAR